MTESRASTRWQPVTLENHWVTDFLTAHRGVLRLEPAPLRAHFRFVARHRDEHGAIHLVGCQVRLADVTGRYWQTEGCFTVAAFLEDIIDLTRRSSPRWLCHAPTEARRAFRSGKMLTNAQDLLDDRFYRRFTFDNTAFTLQFKYACPGIDVVHRGDGRLLVRVSDLFGNWDPLRIAGPDGRAIRHDLPSLDTLDEQSLEALEEKPEGFGDFENYPPLVYERDARELLFRNELVLNELIGRTSSRTPKTSIGGPWRNRPGSRGCAGCWKGAGGTSSSPTGPCPSASPARR